MVYNETDSPPPESDDLRKMVFAALFAALISVGAYIRVPIPISPVPLTAQVLFVFLAGTMLGKKWGTISVLVYLLLGIIGLPVFAGGASGLGILLGPTGGYLVGFVFAALLIGYLKEIRTPERFISNASIIICGLAVIYLAGVTQMMAVADLELIEALTIGVVPFVIADLIKVSIASYITTKYEI
ncbi:BioY protein [Methanosalsum zhilinae DSM 4017]|uniref:BioY protein n=1 Tax=Methanosalsum zhilinae (strain DSM 4017 / NBRC 107636 / OCM 62 / WeN5) TaxID=679901 RepID=F7XN81_METZD|nr:biotin transporter BioY [Methanosalsum zhilinae]AEH60038.1 BioY protein [Methanosalsum zhilinae DSM 4017]